LKTSFTAFCRRNLGFFKLAVTSNLEYRLNFLLDSLFQPMVSSIVEMVLWTAIFLGAQATEIAGFGKNYYLAYALWTTFIARITVNWMYEFRMIEEIDGGSINGLLSRPMSYYEYYLSQLLGYKVTTALISLCFPVFIIWAFDLPTIWNRLPLTMALIIYYLFFVYGMSFCIASLAFFFNKVHSLTTTKNLALWLLTGELFPLDLMPENLKNLVLQLPFSNGAYIPVGYLTGRIGGDVVIQGFMTTTAGLILVSCAGYFLWKLGLRRYVGTGA
jgi:ABC-2 type transport system permease protein